MAKLLRTDDEFALAIETALGAASQNIVTDTMNDGRAAIEYLKRTDGGRATFLALDTIRGGVMKDAPERDPGFVGVASELVNFDEKYRAIAENLLGRTVIAEALPDAITPETAYAAVAISSVTNKNTEKYTPCPFFRLSQPGPPQGPKYASLHFIVRMRHAVTSACPRENPTARDGSAPYGG